MLIEEAVPELCLFIAEPALQLVSREAKKKIENIIHLTSDASFKANELFLHVKGADNFRFFWRPARIEHYPKWVSYIRF